MRHSHVLKLEISRVQSEQSCCQRNGGLWNVQAESSDDLWGVQGKWWNHGSEKRCKPVKNITHAHNTVIVDIVCGKKKSGSTTIYHSKYPNSSYILITTVYYKNVFIVPYFFFYMVIFLVIYILLLEFHIFLISKLIFLEILSLKLKSLLEPITLYAHMKQFLPLHLFLLKTICQT